MTDSEKKDIQSAVYKNLQRHRNLCENFRLADIEVVVTNRLKIELEVKIWGNVESYQARNAILYHVVQAISSDIHFCSFEEMRAKGLSSEEIFDGPRLNSGFLDEKELREFFKEGEEPRTKKEDYRKYIEEKVSKLYPDIMKVIEGLPEIIEVIDLSVRIMKDSSETRSDASASESRKGPITFCLSELELTLTTPDNADATSVETIKNIEKVDFQVPSPGLPPETTFPSIPQGVDIGVSGYYSLQRDFPLIYGIGREGLPDSFDDKRKAQAKQFKAYLLFFEQLMANYLAQLGNIKRLFSFRNDDSPTYAVQIPKDVPDYRKLFYCEDKNKEDREPIEPPPLKEEKKTEKEKKKEEEKRKEKIAKNERSLQKTLEAIIENPNKKLERRKLFLDHLLSRFAEKFEVVSIYKEKGKRTTSDGSLTLKADHDRTEDKEVEHSFTQKIINTQSEILLNYVPLTKKRAKGFNRNQIYDKEYNCSGLEFNLRKRLDVDKEKSGEIIFSESWIERLESEYYYEKLREEEPERYEKLRVKKDPVYGFAIVDASTDTLFLSEEYGNRETREYHINLFTALGRNKLNYYLYQEPDPENSNDYIYCYKLKNFKASFKNKKDGTGKITESGEGKRDERVKELVRTINSSRAVMKFPAKFPFHILNPGKPKCGFTIQISGVSDSSSESGSSKKPNEPSEADFSLAFPFEVPDDGSGVPEDASDTTDKLSKDKSFSDTFPIILWEDPKSSTEVEARAKAKAKSLDFLIENMKAEVPEDEAEARAKAEVEAKSKSKRFPYAFPFKFFGYERSFPYDLPLTLGGDGFPYIFSFKIGEENSKFAYVFPFELAKGEETESASVVKRPRKDGSQIRQYRKSSFSSQSPSVPIETKERFPYLLPFELGPKSRGFPYVFPLKLAGDKVSFPYRFPFRIFGEGFPYEFPFELQEPNSKFSYTFPFELSGEKIPDSSSVLAQSEDTDKTPDPEKKIPFKNGSFIYTTANDSKPPRNAKAVYYRRNIALKELIRLGYDEKNYTIAQEEGGKSNYFYLNGHEYLKSSKFPTPENAKKALEIFCQIIAKYPVRPIYVLEHIFLAPKDFEKSGDANQEDFYSFQVTVALQPSLLDNPIPEERKNIESLINDLIPAHIYPRIIWLDKVHKDKLAKFTSLYWIVCESGPVAKAEAEAENDEKKELEKLLKKILKKAEDEKERLEKLP